MGMYVVLYVTEYAAKRLYCVLLILYIMSLYVTLVVDDFLGRQLRLAGGWAKSVHSIVGVYVTSNLTSAPACYKSKCI